MNNFEKIKLYFPIFKNNPDLIYFDNASTTQKPKSVIKSLIDFYSKHNANVHRGLYPLSENATLMYENARKNIAEFINADKKEIIFTTGTTDGINNIALSLSKSNLIPINPKILVTELEHHSNILPWQQLNPKRIDYIPLKNTNIIDYSNYDIISINYVSNVTGAIFNIDDLTNELNNKKKRPYIVLDCAQAIGHLPIDVKKLNIDFIVFSGHKMYGPTGIGVIYGKKELLLKMEPFKVGGGMISKVNRNTATWADLPEKFEAGTPSIADAISLSSAVDFIKKANFNIILKHEQILRLYLIKKLRSINNIIIYHPDKDELAYGIVSFSIKGVHPHDIAQVLGGYNICVRAGHHCTQILHREVFQIPASLRISFAIYNTLEEIDKFIDILKFAINQYIKKI